MNELAKNKVSSSRKLKKGTVVSNKMQKTVRVKVDRTYRHPIYEKVVTRGKTYYAHNESLTLNVGDVVQIEETRPLSRLKRWRVVEVMAK
jgi:small subunit ribosomal protein S17